MELTKQDIDVLIESLDCWEQKDFSGDLMSAILGGMIPMRDPEMKAKYEADRAAEKVKGERDRKNRKERSIMLKAKLLSIRDSTEAAALLNC